ncbi:ribbon-helix-helix domain-containing protein [Deinococcus radiophilus]|uniref:Antitoxin n=1 Tax=Deinococcus radiophilus TaxID=32062 RepID=A0A431VSW4_9DEIO|nr:ribbon-helix-helix domain-containing protein [Deinococcus radiophilus]RTR26229.1 antitoxin [Deinococcus radiophilus]UFA50320.1 ribbon-helix-helix domain-containing protein [Deinococcus radiophilus]
MSYATRISATLPPELSHFLDDYQKRHGLDTRSAALAEAVRALQTSELEAAYRDLGNAQAEGLELYPANNMDGLEQP